MVARSVHTNTAQLIHESNQINVRCTFLASKYLLPLEPLHISKVYSEYCQTSDLSIVPSPANDCKKSGRLYFQVFVWSVGRHAGDSSNFTLSFQYAQVIPHFSREVTDDTDDTDDTYDKHFTDGTDDTDDTGCYRLE